MGSESIGTGGYLPDVHNDSVESTSNPPYASGIEIQHVSISGESGQEGLNGTGNVSDQPTRPRQEIPSTIASNGIGWAIVQLTDAVDYVPVLDVERDLKRILVQNGTKFLFPAISRQGMFDKASPYANYVFVSSSLPDSKVLKLEDSRFVDFVLCVPGGAGRWRSISKLSDQEISDAIMVVPQHDIIIGAAVRVISGDWKGLEGTLLNLIGDSVKVSLILRSRRRILVLTRAEIVEL